MKELYYYNEAAREGVQTCQVIKETPETYTVDRGFKCTIKKDLMMVFDCCEPTRFFETREQAEKSHLCFLKSHVISLKKEAKSTLNQAVECEALIEKLYGGKRK